MLGQAVHGRSRRRVQRTVDLVVLLVDPLPLRLRHLPAQPYRGARLLKVSIHVGGHPREERRSVGWPLVGHGAVDGDAIDVGLELAPEGVSRTAAGPHVQPHQQAHGSTSLRDPWRLRTISAS
jgi:hypothetical protein